MRSPLSKRLPRELRHNLGKYLGMFLMMAFATAFTSGYLLAATSIESILDGMDETYAIEDGRFSCDFEPEEDALDAVTDLGVTLHEDFYRQVPLAISADDESEIEVRVYGNRDEVNLPAYAEGTAPEKAGEIALDRVFASNHDLAVGDPVTVDGHECTVTGIMTLPDYQALFEHNTDFMFNAMSFAVALMAPEGYEELSETAEVYNYAFTFDDQSLDRAARSDIEEDMIDALVDNDAVVADFIDAEDNQAIGYAYDDVTGDQTMWTVLLILLVVIMAFVFVVLTGATIEQESAVIGTMLASGWRKGELVRHYLVLPALIGLAAVVAGLAVGLTLLSDPMKDLYYNSYSLPPYEMAWNWHVVFITAVVPYLLLVGITLLGLLRKMRFTPLQFLRHEVSGRKRGGRLHLPERLGYPARFRLRVLMRNWSHFVTLFFGIMFASLLLLFGICMLPVVDNYAHELRETVAAPYQYVLKAPLEIQGTDEEREMYAAALRLIEDHDRLDENRDAIDAAERLQDNDELLDALERLQDNEALLDALDRLESQQGLVDAAQRLQSKQAIIAAAQRLQANPSLMAAAQRLQSKSDLVAAAQRLQGNQKVVDAATRLQDKQDLVAAAKRLQSKQDIIAAAQRLEGKQDLVAAAQRLQSKQDLVAAAQRLEGKQDVVAAAQRMQGKQDVIAAAQHAQAGTATEEELALIAGLDAQTQADLQTVSSMDAQTKADMQTVAAMDAQTQADMALAAKMDSQTEADLKLVAGMDKQTKADMETLQNASSQTLADIETVSKMDSQTKKDLAVMQGASAQSRKDLELVAGMDSQTRADIQTLQGASAQTRADLELVSNADSQTRADIELISNLDEKTRADLELVRDMDEDLLDDLRLAADIDEDAHLVNTTKLTPEQIGQAEKVAMGSVEVERQWGGTFEEITVYGIQPDSAYWKGASVGDGVVLAGEGLLEKTKAEVGSSIQLFDRNAGEAYTVEVSGETSNKADTALYMSLDDFNELFGEDADYFNAYASAEPLELDERYVSSVIQPSDMDKISTQMADSMGDIMFMIMMMAVPVYLILVYLLTKTVIDRSARSISYMKVFGYRNKEVNGLYVRPITYAVLFSLVASIPLIVLLIAVLLKVVFMSYAGNFPLIIPASRYVVLVVVGMIAYALVAFLHIRRIKRVPLSLAMKVQE